MTNYYSLVGTVRKGNAIAYTPKGTSLEYKLIRELEGLKELPFEFELKNVRLQKGELLISEDLNDLEYLWTDYQPNNCAWPILSEKFKEVVENNLTGEEGIDWIKAIVKGNGEKRVYYILRFNKILDVLDKEMTLFDRGSDSIIKPYFSLSKIHFLSVFYRPQARDLWKITSSIFVNNNLKRKIQKEKISGVSFEKTRVSPLSILK